MSKANKDNKEQKENKDKDKEKLLLKSIEALLNEGNNQNIYITQTINNQLPEEISKKAESKQGNQESESKFSIKSFLDKYDKSENLLSQKKNFFVLSNDLKENNEDISLKMKREILKNKLISDKDMVMEHEFNEDFHEKVSNELYLGLSIESRKYLTESRDELFYKKIYQLIGHNADEMKKNCLISNEIIMNLCSGFISLNDILPNSNVEESSNSSSKENPIYETIVRDTIEVFPSQAYNKEIKKEANVNYYPKSIIDEDLNEKDLDILIEFVEMNPNCYLTVPINEMLNFFKTGVFNGIQLKISNKEKNEMITELKKEYKRILDEEESKVNDETVKNNKKNQSKIEKNDKNERKEKKEKEFGLKNVLQKKELVLKKEMNYNKMYSYNNKNDRKFTDNIEWINLNK